MRTRNKQGQFLPYEVPLVFAKNCIVCGGVFKKGRRNMKWWTKAEFCSYKCKGVVMRGKPRISKMTPDGIRRIKLKAIGRPSPLRGRVYVTVPKRNLTMRIRECFQYRQWRSDVFTRDKFTCQWCGDEGGGNLNADHIKPFSVILQEYEITTYEQALSCAPLWNINNGRTLCKPCHKKTSTFAGRANMKSYQMDLI